MAFAAEIGNERWMINILDGEQVRFTLSCSSAEEAKEFVEQINEGALVQSAKNKLNAAVHSLSEKIMYCPWQQGVGAGDNWICVYVKNLGVNTKNDLKQLGIDKEYEGFPIKFVVVGQVRPA